MENTPLIYKKIIEVMADMNAIAKARKNQQQGFVFRGIDDVMNEAHSSLAKCGVFVLPQVLEENRTTGKTRSGGDMFYTRLKIKFAFYAEDGSHVDAVVIGEAMDTADKASNKALSIGLKYAMLQVFCIPTEDEKDPDATTPEPAAGTISQPPKPAAPAAKPAKKAAPKFAFEPKGGETTAEEKKEIGALLGTKYSYGALVFSKDEAKAYSNMRKDYTAREVIDAIKKELAARLNPTQQMQTAGDMMRAKQEQQLPPAVETVKNVMQGEVVQVQPAQQAAQDIF